MKGTSSSEKNGQNQRPRITEKPRQKIRLRQRIAFVVGGVFSLLIIAVAVAYFQFAKVEKVYAATSGDYKAVATGNWNSTGTWQTYNGSSWVAAATTPTSANGVITIQSGYTVTVTANVTVDQVVINSGGEVDLNNGDTLTIAHNTGTDFDVTGVFKNAGIVTFNASATMAYENGGIYEHDFTTTAGTIPTATWNTGSTCQIIGYTSNANPPTGFQAFYNFTWNCPNQTQQINLLGALTTINGDFKLISSGTGQLRLSTANSTFTIGGNYIQTGGTISVVNANNKDTLMLYGNFTQAGGTLTMSLQSNARTQIVFAKSGTQTFTYTGDTVIGKISYIVLGGSILDMGTSTAYGYDFTVNSGGALILASPYGITASSMQGNVQCTDNRSYSTGADYTYNGTSAQVTGDGLPSQVRNLTLNNSSNCTLTASTSASGTMIFTSGIWIATTDTLTLGISTSTLGTLSVTNGWVDGYFQRWIAAATTSNVLFPVGTLSNYNGANFSFTTAPTAGSIVSTFTAANPGTSGLPLTDAGDNCTNTGYGYWTFGAANSFAGGAYSVNLYANGFPGLSDYTHLHIFRRANSGSSWTINGTHAAGTGSNAAPVANRTSMTLLGQYGIVSPGTNNVLPIELISFNAAPEGNIVALSWATASEINNDYFTIERSANGQSFEEVLREPGAGTSMKEIHYTASDDGPLNGINYYRLKQTDYNGKFVYFPVKVVEYGIGKNLKNVAIQTIGPNPFTNNFNINYSVAQQGEVYIQISNTSGQLVYKEKVNVDEGVNAFSFYDKQGLPPGVYIINMISNGEAVTQKLIKK